MYTHRRWINRLWWSVLSVQCFAGCDFWLHFRFSIFLLCYNLLQKFKFFCWIHVSEKGFKWEKNLQKWLLDSKTLIELCRPRGRWKESLTFVSYEKKKINGRNPFAMWSICDDDDDDDEKTTKNMAHRERYFIEIELNDHNNDCGFLTFKGNYFNRRRCTGSIKDIFDSASS